MTVRRVRVGIDLVQVSRIAESLEHFGDRFLRRVFTDGEIAYATAAPAAARSASRPASPPRRPRSRRWGWWSDRHATGAISRCGAARPAPATWRCTAPCARPPRRLGVGELALSMSHEGDYATAVVVTTTTRPRTDDRFDHHGPQREHPTHPQGARPPLSKDAPTLADDADLYQAGMTSHASVNVMLALEGEFDVEFPDHMLKRSVFESIAAIRAAIDELTGG